MNNSLEDILRNEYSQVGINPSDECWDRIRVRIRKRVILRRSAISFAAAAATLFVVFAIARKEEAPPALIYSIVEKGPSYDEMIPHPDIRIIAPSTNIIHNRSTAVLTEKNVDSVKADKTDTSNETTSSNKGKTGNTIHNSKKPPILTEYPSGDEYFAEAASDKSAVPIHLNVKWNGLNIGESYDTGISNALARQASAQHTGELADNPYLNSNFPPEYQHLYPINIGISIDMPFSKRFSAGIGINYSLLRSDINLPLHNLDPKRQSLHLLGVPVRIKYNLLTTDKFGLYCSSGGMLEKCVLACFDGERLEEKDLQWSVSASIGTQYRIVDRTYIYLEGECYHYFTETQLKTIRTQNPTALSLNAGIRFSLQ